MSKIQFLTKTMLQFPIRYYLVATVFAFVFLSNIEFIRSTEGQILVDMFQILGIQSLYSNGSIFIENGPSVLRFELSIYIQTLFLIFFPTVAFSSGTNFIKRLKILSFGIVCFLVFILTEFLAIFGFTILNDFFRLIYLDNIRSYIPFMVSSLLLTLVGGLVIALTLFSTMTIPKRTKIKLYFKRDYRTEYHYLIGIFGGSLVLAFILMSYLQIETDSPIAAYATLLITTTMFLSYFVSYRLYRRQIPNWWKWLSVSNGGPRDLSLSFLIPAYNEEKSIGGCIESIDKAAAKYRGYTEIVVVNDGSTDNTEKIIERTFQNLKHSSGKFFTIPNSGKGYALKLGLEKTVGEIIFRTDADSILDENAITPLMNHFKDPKVGSASAYLFPLEGKSIWLKAQNLLYIEYMWIKMEQHLFDSIIVQPGPSTAYRKSALLRAGGWEDNIFGEDGELTSRVARFGYRGVFEANSIVYTDLPETLTGNIQQRSRWSLAFYHSRGRNLNILKEINSPRSIIFQNQIFRHGAEFAHTMMLPILVASLMVGSLDPYRLWLEGSSLASLSEFILTKLLIIQLATIGLHGILLAYPLTKLKKIKDLKYIFPMRAFNFIIQLWIKPQVMDVLLRWSSKWKNYDDESFKDLRKEMRRSVDPFYPDG